MSDETPAPNEGTVDEVLENVGDDPQAAAEALEAEQEKPEDEQRSTLTEPLEKLAEEAVPTGSAGDVEKWVGDDPERAQRALDLEQSDEGQKRKGLTAHLESVVAAAEGSDGEDQDVSEDALRSVHDPGAPGGRVPDRIIGPTDEMQRG